MSQGYDDDGVNTLEIPTDDANGAGGAGDEAPPAERTAALTAGDLGGRLYAATDIGRARECNEDYYLVDEDLSLVVVADGMGGHHHGEVASRLAATGIADFLRGSEGAPADAKEAEDLVARAVREVNRRIYVHNMAKGYQPGRGMGTTVVGLWGCLEQNAVIFHVGDSRLYHYRQGALHSGTTDHSLYESWKASGKQGEAPKRNVLQRAVGVYEDVEAEISWARLEAQDVTLLCSDGLTRMLNDNALHEAAGEAAARGPEAVGRALVRRANDKGGRDNITLALTVWG